LPGNHGGFIRQSIVRDKSVEPQQSSSVNTQSETTSPSKQTLLPLWIKHIDIRTRFTGFGVNARSGEGGRAPLQRMKIFFLPEVLSIVALIAPPSY